MSEQRAFRNPKWNREETILAADVFVNRLGRKVNDDGHPEAIALSALLRRAPWHADAAKQPNFRSPASVVLKFSNLFSVDPDRDPPRLGSANASAMDREIMQEFHGREIALAAEADSIRNSLLLPSPAASPEVADAIASTANVAGRRSGQGRNLDVQCRAAIEAEAMRRARNWLRSERWTVEDVSATRPYDYLATRGADTLHVEVKGTTGDGSAVLLTPNEVIHARAHHPDTALFVVRKLVVALDPYGHCRATDGDSFVVQPWLPTDDSLTATGWSHTIDLPDDLLR